MIYSDHTAPGLYWLITRHVCSDIIVVLPAAGRKVHSDNDAAVLPRQPPSLKIPSDEAVF